MKQHIFSIIRKAIALPLIVALVLSSVNAAQAVPLLRLSDGGFGNPYLNFRRNQERMRVETQALSARMVDCGIELGLHPFASRLLGRYRSLVLPNSESSVSEKIESPNSPAVWIPWAVGLGVIAFTSIAIIQMLGFAPSDGSVSLACGNLFIILLIPRLAKYSLDTVIEIELPVTVGEEVLQPDFVPPPPEVIRITLGKLLENMLDLLDIRGRLQAGLAEYFDDGVITTKVNAPKRGALSVHLLSAFELLAKGHELKVENGVWRISGHVRAPTAPSADGKLRPISAHPHQYQEDRMEAIGEFTEENGRVAFKEESKTVIIKLGHNGDVKKARIHGRSYLTSSSMYDVLDKILGISGTVKTGDSKVLSGLLDLFFTLGRTSNAMRLAYHTRLVQATDKDESVRFPPQETFQTLGDFMKAGIQEQVRRTRLGAAGMRLTQTPQAQLDELKARLLQVVTTPLEWGSVPAAIRDIELQGPALPLASSHSDAVHMLRGWTLDRRVALIDKAVDAYFKNDLYTAFSETAAYVEGTFGVVAETTGDSEDNQELVAFSRSQQMSVGVDASGQFAMGSSSRHALDKMRYRLDLDNNGQILGLSWRVDPATGRREFTRRSHLEEGNRELTPEEIEAGTIDRHLNPYMEKPPETDIEDHVGYEEENIPKAYQKFKASLDNPTSWNSETVRTIADILDDVISGRRKGDLMFVGSEKSLETARIAVETANILVPGIDLKTRYMPSSQIMKYKSWPADLKNKLGITRDTFPIIISASGGDTFDTARACELLTGFVTDMVLVSGLWDVELASTMGQELHKDSKFSKRIINTYGGWSLAEPATLTDAAMEFALTQTFLKVFHEVLNRHPGEKPLNMFLEREDFDVLQNQITAEYMQHAGEILGIKTNSQGQPVLKEDKPEHIATKKHDELVTDAARFAQHSLENIVINFMVVPFIYAVTHELNFPLFPSSWPRIIALFGHGLALVGHWFWNVALSNPHIALIDNVSQYLPQIAIPAIVQSPISWIGATLLFVTYIVLDMAFVILFPWVLMRLYRKATGRQVGARRGPVMTAIVGRAKVKLEQLYTKLHAGMLNENQPVIIGADEASSLHRLAHRIFRGTRILHSLSSAEGINQTDRNGSEMIDSQASLVQHLDVGPEIVKFEHLPYSKGLIRAPYKNFAADLALELQLQPAQILALDEFLKTLPDQAKNFYLWQLSGEIGSQLDLHDDRLALFKTRFNGYLERQLALEAFFKIRFADAENWLQHYVFAYEWAKRNAHPWFLRAAIYIIDRLPFHKQLIQKYPLLALYIDIARTFVGTSRLTTASPYEGEEIIALRKQYPSILKDLRDSRSTASRPGIVSPEREIVPAHTLRLRVPIQPSVAMQNLLRSAHKKKSADTSLILKVESEDVEPTVIGDPVAVLKDGTLSPKPENMSTETYNAIRSLFSLVPLNFYGVNITLAVGMGRIMEYIKNPSEAPGVGGLYIDAHFIEDIVAASADDLETYKPIQGAIPVGMWELHEEKIHQEVDRQLRGEQRDQEEEADSKKRFDTELYVVEEKIRIFLNDDSELREHGMAYLSDPENAFDPLHFGERIYRPAHERYMRELNNGKSREDAANAAIEAIHEPLGVYIHEAFKLEDEKQKPDSSKSNPSTPETPPIGSSPSAARSVPMAQFLSRQSAKAWLSQKSPNIQAAIVFFACFLSATVIGAVYFYDIIPRLFSASPTLSLHVPDFSWNPSWTPVALIVTGLALAAVLGFILLPSKRSLRSDRNWVTIPLLMMGMFASVLISGDRAHLPNFLKDLSVIGQSVAWDPNFPKAQPPTGRNNILNSLISKMFSTNPSPTVEPQAANGWKLVKEDAVIPSAKPSIEQAAPASVLSKADVTNLKRIIDAAKPQSALSLLDELSKQPGAAADVRSALASYRNVAQKLMAFKIALESQSAKNSMDKLRLAAKELTNALKLPAPLNTLKGQLQRGFPDDKDIEESLFGDGQIQAIKDAMASSLLARLNAPDHSSLEGFSFAGVLGFLGAPLAGLRRSKRAKTRRSVLESA